MRKCNAAGVPALALLHLLHAVTPRLSRAIRVTGRGRRTRYEAEHSRQIRTTDGREADLAALQHGPCLLPLRDLPEQALGGAAARVAEKLDESRQIAVEQDADAGPGLQQQRSGLVQVHRLGRA